MNGYGAANQNNGMSYGQMAPPANGYTPASYGGSSNSSNDNGALRRRAVESTPAPSNGIRKAPSSANVVKKLDFMFPKVDTEYTVQTESGGVVSMIAVILIAMLVLAETSSWLSQNRSTVEHAKVDTSLGQRMRVNLNITFPAMACVDLHVDVMDVAGDSQINIEDTLKKRRLSARGDPLGKEELVESNSNQQDQENRQKILKKPLPENYCGPCFGAQVEEKQCCNTCDKLLEAYRVKGWNAEAVLRSSEQCVREGRDRKAARKITKGQGCNLSGFMVLNRVAGNFHIAMGEGIERNGRHIHTFDPEDSENYNSSHIIHDLSFGPPIETTGRSKNNGVGVGSSGLHGVTKIVTAERGTTGLFQYFLKIVPTTVTGDGGQSSESGSMQTNRYFYTERFRPLMKEYRSELKVEDLSGKAAADAGGAHKGPNKHDHHNVKNSILPGVFFIYEIYPFEVEVSRVSVPFTHLLIRLMAVIGGVLTVLGFIANTFLAGTGGKGKRRGPLL